MNKIADVYYNLLKNWCDALIPLQMSGTKRKELEGGMVCPACGRMHGRTADAILPMMYMAKRTGESKYLNCAKGLFRWSDNMFRHDSYYVNDMENGWTGITVFFCVQLGEALKAFSDLLTEEEAIIWKKRYFATAEYVRGYIDKIGGTINYPVSGVYAMALAAQMSEGSHKEKYLKKARELAEFSRSFILESGLLCGEGHPCDALTEKGARAIDIGYNMEESIPALLEYCHLVEDDKTKAAAMKALETHLKFFLPDGGMDNSFGSRSYKWSYWGSRTSDGFQAAASLLGAECKELQRKAYRNAKLLQQCTQHGLLLGGPMFEEAGEPPCIHHTFCHAKDIAKALMILEEKTLDKKYVDKEPSLPYFDKKMEYFPDIRTYHIEYGSWRVTLTDYDYEYCAASHAAGGAMTLLWNSMMGPICAGTMNRYYIVEPNNMQILQTQEDICLTPRMEYVENGIRYRNIHDLTADFICTGQETGYDFTAKGLLRDENQNGSETYCMEYHIGEDRIVFAMECSREAYFYIPVIAGKKDILTFESEQELVIRKRTGILRLCTSGKFEREDTGRRIFNPVGGFMAYPAVLKLDAGMKYEVSIISIPEEETIVNW